MTKSGMPRIPRGQVCQCCGGTGKLSKKGRYIPPIFDTVIEDFHGTPVPTRRARPGTDTWEYITYPCPTCGGSRPDRFYSDAGQTRYITAEMRHDSKVKWIMALCVWCIWILCSWSIVRVAPGLFNKDSYFSSVRHVMRTGGHWKVSAMEKAARKVFIAGFGVFGGAIVGASVCARIACYMRLLKNPPQKTPSLKDSAIVLLSLFGGTMATWLIVNEVYWTFAANSFRR